MILQMTLLSIINYLTLIIFQQIPTTNLLIFCDFCSNSLNTKMVKVSDLFNLKDEMLKSLKPFVVYNFVCSAVMQLTMCHYLSFNNKD